MDPHPDLDAGRKKAVAVEYLQRLLERHGFHPSQHAAEEIANLASDRSNPVNALFSAAGAHDRPSTARPSTAQQQEGFKSSISKFWRSNKHSLSESKGLGSVSSVCDLRDQPPGTSALYAELFGDPPFEKSAQANSVKKPRSRSIVRASSSKSPVKPVPNSSVFPSSTSTAKPSSANQYKCIICQEQLSSKGVCKRHLDEQHVAPKVYDCEKCGERFTAKKQAKEHSNNCGQGVFLYSTTKQEGKKFYACEFTGEFFVSKSKYLEHLLALSERTEDRPPANPRLKLNSILEHTALHKDVIQISLKMYGSKLAWQSLELPAAHVTKAVGELEDATILENGMIESGGKSQKSVRTYLNSLFSGGTLPRSNSQGSRRSRSSTVTQRRSPHESEDGRSTPRPDSRKAMQSPWGLPRSMAAVSSIDDTMPAPVMPPMPAPEAVMASVSAETLKKRHLSDTSRNINPERQGAGPPIMSQIPYAAGPSMPDMSYALPNSNSTTSLPFRSQDSPQMIEQMTADMYSMRTASTATPTLSSDAASESTLMSSYHEPEALDQMSYDYYSGGYWNTHQGDQNYNFNFTNSNSSNISYGMAPPQIYYANSDPSRSSIATASTYAIEPNEYDQKFAHFDPLPHNSAQQGTTFFWDGDDDFHDPHGLS